MRACVQRVASAQVTVHARCIGQIGQGLVVLLGVAHDDGPKDVAWMANRLVGLRIFEDDAGKLNRSVVDVGGSLLVVSQFTLLGDCRKGRRPSFVAAAEPARAEQLYEDLTTAIRRQGIEVATGKFRTHMEVALVNDGPVTLVIDSPRPVTTQ